MLISFKWHCSRRRVRAPPASSDPHICLLLLEKIKSHSFIFLYSTVIWPLLSASSPSPALPYFYLSNRLLFIFPSILRSTSQIPLIPSPHFSLFPTTLFSISIVLLQKAPQSSAPDRSPEPVWLLQLFLTHTCQNYFISHLAAFELRHSHAGENVQT